MYEDFRKVVYVDRLKPVSAVYSFDTFNGNSQARDLTIQSTDLTADTVNVFLDLPANLSESQVLALVGQGNSAGAIDRDLFNYRYNGGVKTGNHVVTIVTREITGNTSVQRIAGNYTQTTAGAGLGDLNFDGVYASGDVTGTGYGMEALVYPNAQGNTNTQFNPAADLNADGLIDSRDLYAQRDRYVQIGAPPATIDAARQAVLRRGDLTGNFTGLADATDIDFLYAHLGDTAWKYDFDVDGWPAPSGADQQDVDTLIRRVFQTEYGDANLDGHVNLLDFNALAGNFNHPGSWETGDFSGDGLVNLLDFNLLAAEFNFAAAGATLSGDPQPPISVLVQNWGQATGVYVPEPGALASVILAAGVALSHRRVRFVRAVVHGNDLLSRRGSI